MRVERLEEQQRRLIKALLKFKRENDLLKTKLALYEVFLTPEQKYAANYYTEQLKGVK